MVQRLMQELANGPQSERAAQRYALSVELASVPQQIRGFGHVKVRHLAEARNALAGADAATEVAEPAVQLTQLGRMC
jgi:hypothetical protein